MLARNAILLKVTNRHHLLILPLAVVAVVALVDHPVAVGLIFVKQRERLPLLDDLVLAVLGKVLHSVVVLSCCLNSGLNFNLI